MFEQRPSDHLNNHGCKKCGIEKVALSNTKTTEQFISEAKLVHKNKYDYSLVEYISSKIPVKIKCNTCNKVFEQYPDKHINAKQGCRYCSSSKGEEKILNWLEQNNKVYKHIKKYDDLIDISQLSYDFYLPEYNLLVEYNGSQHYSNTFKKPLHDFHKQLHHDWLKRKYAKDHNINLLVIPYLDFDNIEKILEDYLSSLE